MADNGNIMHRVFQGFRFYFKKKHDENETLSLTINDDLK